MKTKFYFMALATSVALAACTNDELEGINDAEFQKAELVALDDIQAAVSMGSGIQSRIANGQWELTDEVGVGFTNWVAETSGLYQAAGNGSTRASFVNENDGKLYANHRLFRTDGSWKFENVVYEGLHYAYYPLDAKHTAVKALTAKVGTEQVYGEEADFEANGIFAISSMYDLVKDQAGKAPVVNFALNTISNRLKLNLEVADFGGITDPIIVKSVAVKADNGTPFVQSATVKEVPMVSYTNRNTLTSASTAAEIATAETADATATATAFKNAFVENKIALDYSDAKNAMSTTVKGHTGFTASANTYAVNIFSFPIITADISALTVDELSIEVVTNYGTIIVKNEATAPAGETAAQKVVREANNKTFESLLKVLKGTHDTVKFTDREMAASATIKLDLKVDKPALNAINVASAEEWAAAITIASQVEAVETINVTDNLAISLTDLPANVNTITIATDKKLTISGDVTSEGLTIQGAGKVEVAAETNLTVNGTIAAPAVMTISNEVANWGDINVGENGFLTLSGTATNHANIINKKSLTVYTFTNHKDVAVAGNASTHDCEGIVKNYATLTVDGGSTFTNKGTYYTIGANASVTAMTNEGTAITEEGGKFDGISGTGTKKATVSTPAQMELAINKATEITVNGAVSLSTDVTEQTTIILANNAELYMLGDSPLAGVSAATSTIKKIQVAGVNTKISTKSPQYIYEIEVKAGKDLTVLKDSKLGVDKFGYEINSTVTNNGFGVIVATPGDTRGSWVGLAWNKQINANGEEVVLSTF